MERTKVNNGKRNSKGLSLIEASMVLALSAIIISGVMVYYQSASENKKTQDTMALVMGVMSTINTTFANELDLSRLLSRDGSNTILLLNSSNIPDKNKDKKNNKIITPYNGDLKVLGMLPESKYKNEKFTIELFNIPKSACDKLGMMNLGNQHYSTSINKVDPNLSYGILVKNITPEKIAQMCDQEKNNIYYTLKK